MSLNIVFDQFGLEKTMWGNLKFFNKCMNSPLGKKYNLCNFLILMFLKSAKAHFLSSTLPNTLFDQFALQNWR